MHQHEAEDCVRLVPIFQALDANDVAQVAKLVRDRQYAAGETLFAAGTAADALMIIAHGQVKVTQTLASGREQLLRVLGPGEFDGEAVLFTPSERTTSGVALTQVVACTISRQDFQQLLKKTPALALNMLNSLGERVVQLEAQTTAANVASVSERLAGYLVETSAALGQAHFTLPLQKKDLAAYLGTTPETVSRKLAAFERDGLIKQTGRSQITILDSDDLSLVE